MTEYRKNGSAVGGGGAGLPVATGAGEVPVSTGAGSTYAASPISTEVLSSLDAILGGDPAGSAIISDGGGATTVTSADVSGFLAAADAAAARAALGLASVPPVALGAAYNAGTSATAYLGVLGTPAAAPEFGPGQSLVYLFRPVTTPGGAQVIVSHAAASDGVERGFHLRAGDNAGARGELALYLKGLAADAVTALPGADFTGDLNTPHVVAISISLVGAIRYSWDGGAVQSIAALAGTYVPPISGDPMRVGQLIDGAPAPATSIQPIALRMYSTVLSDADLVTVADSLASYRLADPAAGTLTASIHATQLRGASTSPDAADPTRRWGLVGALLVHEQVP